MQAWRRGKFARQVADTLCLLCGGVHPLQTAAAVSTPEETRR